ncbi:hypothetical protein CNBC7190 [Cryptococcus deneoformans B-3501A]|uniref:hypothetical protein n=1 Tax=Cryptococcus deneoformans (strain B-3501A) TaxID=283643 RepID=UPI000042CB39|nr:hypothetical protein CNBC7190 [Cryptococcus neoformans var. neoformans B-3501A]EAL21684.1 hypothetical protein CNBC7190 [Cryptococcus neoformans var. neoformans B-3501A]
MSIHDSTFSALKDMGIDPMLAREAASRFHSVEPAVNWCFGDGANWQPTTVAESMYGGFNPRHREGTSVEHREVIEVFDSPSGSPKPRHSHIPLGSNNPFLPTQPRSPHPASHPLPQPPLPPRSPSVRLGTQGLPVEVDDGNDSEGEELRKAIALSQNVEHSVSEAAPLQDAMDVDGKRDSRERSERASGAPPPSPKSDMPGTIGVTFGPSTKDDVDGKLALVPTSQNNNTTSNEDADLDKAIQESLMTASFHSASAEANKERPQPTKRGDGVPLVFYSPSGRYTYVAQILQAFAAVPRIQTAFQENVDSASSGDDILTERTQALSDSFGRMIDEPFSFYEIDDTAKIITEGSERNQLPPLLPTMDFQLIFIDLFERAAIPRLQGMAKDEDELNRLREECRRVFETKVTGHTPDSITSASYVTFVRQPTGNDVYTQLADVFWGPEAQTTSIKKLGDVLTVYLDWKPSSAREVWKLDEEITLDRFLQSNAAWAANRRGLQAVSAGNARRIKEKIESLTLHDGNNYLDSFAALIENLRTKPKNVDITRAVSREGMKGKIETILTALKTKVADLEEELKEQEKAASAEAFETDDPQYNQHVFNLRAILFHDGAMVGQKHLYMYVRGKDDRWWKIQEHEATEVEWEAIIGDRTGIWMEGGPYMLLYARQGDRPSSPESSPTRPSDVDVPPHSNSIILESNNTITPTLPPDYSESTSTSASNGSKSQSSDTNEKNGEGLLLMDMETPEAETEWVEDAGSEANKDLMDIVMGEGGSPKKEEEIKATVHEKADEENKEVEARSTNKDEDTVML